MSQIRVGVLMGGISSERAVSLRSGRAVADALEAAGRVVVPVDLGAGEHALGQLQEARLDQAFLVLHGRFGEDGCVQGLLELLGIPYTGSSVLSSALAMDKLKAKEMFRLHNVPTPPYYVVGAEECEELEERHGSFGYPVAVKPRREGSSVGVGKANCFAELQLMVKQALRYDHSVLVERFVEGKEIAVGILDGRVLGAIEIAPKAQLYDFQSKYESDATEYFMPARLSKTRYQCVLNLAERAAQCLDTSGAVRVDLLATAGHNEYVLEVNTLPGMTESSLMPKIARAAGYEFEDLCQAMLAGARLEFDVPRKREERELRVAEQASSPTAEPIPIAV